MTLPQAHSTLLRQDSFQCDRKMSPASVRYTVFPQENPHRYPPDIPQPDFHQPDSPELHVPRLVFPNPHSTTQTLYLLQHSTSSEYPHPLQASHCCPLLWMKLSPVFDRIKASIPVLWTKDQIFPPESASDNLQNFGYKTGFHPHQNRLGTDRPCVQNCG